MWVQRSAPPTCCNQVPTRLHHVQHPTNNPQPNPAPHPNDPPTKANHVSWKKTGPYNLKCRRIVTLHPARLGRMSEDGSEPDTAADGVRQHKRVLKMGGGGGGGGVGVGAVGDDGGDAMQQDLSVPPVLEGQHQQLQPQPMQQHLNHHHLTLHQQQQLLASAPIPFSSLGGSAAATRAAAQAAVMTNGGGAGGQSVDYLVKFECQLYKLKDDEYSMDVQRLEGDVAFFLDVCGRIVGEMRGVVI